ncbi:conserved hypothetical protein [Candidatus Terasakiella magnetica]|uniref:Tryptophan synthase subunit beta like protein n=1 Tax=Candidatus Terasakiella magnetica TaxID=1867952 RepID=A0A1C3RF94_9PROT|nr:hypothetical protein [Candidatus Terasakiella magnetica]SCA55963.1 conserved hypothetical protein [Candidatus Terasakiella magnetica]
MPFVQRDTSGQITGIFQQSQDGADEEIPLNHPDILAFLNTQDGAAATLLDLAESDMAMARVIEDLIEILTLKGVIDLDDLPAAARDKLNQRQELRYSLEEALAMFGGGKVI